MSVQKQQYEYSVDVKVKGEVITPEFTSEAKAQQFYQVMTRRGFSPVITRHKQH